MATADPRQLTDEVNQLFTAVESDLAAPLELKDAKKLKEVNNRRKQLYVSGEVLETHRIESKLRGLARRYADILLKRNSIDQEFGLDLVAILQGVTEHGLARRILTKLYASDQANRKMAQKLSLNTYKDEALPPDSRFADALRILESIELREESCDDPETLGQAGAIFKRRWERSGRIADLHTSLYFYRRGWLKNPKKDLGYCGVNAAFILDLLAYRTQSMAARDKISVVGADASQREARELRQQMKGQLPALALQRTNENPQDRPAEEYWYHVTMAEVCFGLEDWDEAARWLQSARGIPHDEWERQTTAKQLVAIARMRGFAPPKHSDAPETWPGPWFALRALLGDDTRAAIGSYRGKVGLAMSGGGFRAALYHLGVLARLAECDALRCIEVLSTVSGGSIVGAHYYLALRHRLQTKTDAQLGSQDYVGMVQEVIEQFFAGVQQNLRTRSFANFFANVKMMFLPSYGRSNRIGELYDQYLFSQVNDGHESGRLRRLRDLVIHPKVAQGDRELNDENFKPKFANWRRQAKVPILLLNSTSLNSGHNWQFTATWMGEPPGLMGQEIDINERYRRFYYFEAPNKYLENYPLAYAVAASAGVPALFDPLVLKGVYPGRTVKLVDGGVHDNQGVAGLLDEGCTLLLCSDASGQMDDQDSPSANEFNVFCRSDSILQDRLREAQYQDLDGREKSHALQGLFFIHLKQELETDPIDWINCDDPRPATCRPSCAGYGVNRQIQKLLSEVRTDLDTFTEVEAYALMASGYLMTEHRLRELDRSTTRMAAQGSWAGFDVHAPRRDDWPFNQMLSLIKADPDESDRRAGDLARQLRISAKLLGKVLHADAGVRTWTITILLLLIGVVVKQIYDNWTVVLTLRVDLGIQEIVGSMAVLIVGAILPLAKYLKPIGVLRRWLLMLGVATIGWIGTNFYLWFLDNRYKKRGALTRLLNLPDDH